MKALSLLGLFCTVKCTQWQQDPTDGVWSHAAAQVATWRHEVFAPKLGLSKFDKNLLLCVTMLTLMLRRPFLLLAFVGGVSVVVASNLHALPQNRRPIRGGSQPTGQTLRKYAETDRMPSLFNHDEETYDRYAACLAATEGLRRLRDRDMSDVIQGVTDVEDATRKRKQIASQYVHNSARVLRALGMSVNQFNELGKEVAQDAKLKEKVRYSIRVPSAA